jgi:hypothetical protein
LVPDEFYNSLFIPNKNSYQNKIYNIVMIWEVLNSVKILPYKISQNENYFLYMDSISLAFQEFGIYEKIISIYNNSNSNNNENINLEEVRKKVTPNNLILSTAKIYCNIYDCGTEILKKINVFQFKQILFSLLKIFNNN